MKQLWKYVLTVLLMPVTGIAGLFTLIWTVGTLLTWSTTDVGSRMMTPVFIIGFIFLLGIEGTLLEQCPVLHRRKQKKMKGLDFEGYCAKYLLGHGFHDVHTTPPSGDYGADIVAKDRYGNTWVFQCKYYSSKLGNSCVQEVVAAKKHYKAEKAGVMTNSQLTENARRLAFENAVILFECLD